MLKSVDLAAFANYALNTFDCSEDFEHDAFAVTFEGVRIYVERKRSHFVCHVGNAKHQLPR
ncbi:hypothetical protein ASE73_07750 [Sphingomonas sp. Leaf24]|uniref:hypothetical protein n=1 Tax=unclassified Sphingomonas TaxID=196159 RepID=UPI00070058D5|nr:MULTISPECIES: hypothetical protein [unclassified Sphingomonas]KQM20207.1 hypothetical protein ASE50_16860 [Sphingomonas sp. Leaf5]KQM89470.1 hypothetical protein ASE73_07750 [Sphingomonas sp. Leaf24]